MIIDFIDCCLCSVLDIHEVGVNIDQRQGQESDIHNSQSHDACFNASNTQHDFCCGNMA
jgi:hypothetical protein